MNSNVRSLSSRWSASVRLFIISFLSLYFELVLIRWLPTEIRILAYFTNLTLISCVLGMGIGAIIASKQKFYPWSFWGLLAVMILFAKLYGGLDIPFALASEGHFMWNGLSRINGSIYQYPVMFGFFILNALVFVPIGQILGEAFELLPALRAYSINVFGALAGIGVFALFSKLQAPPFVWFLGGVLVFALLVPIRRTMIVVMIVVIAAGTIEVSTYWSPYYKINVRSLQLSDGTRIGAEIIVNKDSHQQALDLSGKYDSYPQLQSKRMTYDQPYLFGRTKSVLVFGAGTGNDVAAALRAGATHVDAVEIDPVILSLGRKLHPEHPYADARVKVHILDARTFLRTSGEKYDKIVLGYVDSHSLFSAMSSVRLDNFIYTHEFFQEMKQHLTPQGILAVTFTVHEKWIADRLYSLMETTFGASPLVFQSLDGPSNGTVFLDGIPGLAAGRSYMSFDPSAHVGFGATWHYSPAEQGYVSPRAFSETRVLPSDNWPYLYMRAKTIPYNYALCLAVLLLFSYVFVGRATGSGGIRWHFFFLGAGFLVVETKAMTELAIFLGSTWTVNSFVISTVLVLILAANWCVARGWLTGTKTVYTVLLGVLLLSYFAPLNRLLQWDSPLRNWAAVLILCLPMFFAGLLFARHLQQESSSAAALGSNLLGAVLGGMVEYFGMMVGLRPLYLFAFALYVASWVCLGAKKTEALAIAGDQFCEHLP